jgi:TFIIF-interacting CTD phosphatase-like protein
MPMSDEKQLQKDHTVVEERLVDNNASNDEQGDDALHIVGTQRSAQFTDEYYLKLRRKLVSSYVEYRPLQSSWIVQ